MCDVEVSGGDVCVIYGSIFIRDDMGEGSDVRMCVLAADTPAKIAAQNMSQLRNLFVWIS